MSARTGIEWTDATWNPVVGCDRVSPGCAHCYAKQLHDQRHRAQLAGKPQAHQYTQPFEVVQLKPERLTQPMSWRKSRRIFVNSVSDLFHDAVPDEFLDEVFAVAAHCWWHTFQVLTKRPGRMHAYLSDPGRHLAITRRFPNFRGYSRPVGPWPLPNVWLGVSVENQRWADERIPWLLATPAAVRFLSCEPLLGPLDLRQWLELVEFDRDDGVASWYKSKLSWVVAGGESGPHARPCDPAWARSLRDQCVGEEVPFFWKQWGGRTPKSGGRMLDGRTWDQMPGEVLP